MDTREFTSEAEIDKAFSDHIESLKLSGLPYDHVGLMAAWVEAVAQFHEAKEQGPDYTTL